MWYRNRKFVIDNSTRDALIFNFTFHHRNFVISYSYDMTNSELTLAKTHGTHEFNIGYTIGGAHMCKQKKKPRVDCYLFDRSGPEKPTKYKKNNRYSPWMYILP